MILPVRSSIRHIQRVRARPVERKGMVRAADAEPDSCASLPFAKAPPQGRNMDDSSYRTFSDPERTPPRSGQTLSGIVRKRTASSGGQRSRLELLKPQVLWLPRALRYHAQPEVAAGLVDLERTHNLLRGSGEL